MISLATPRVSAFEAYERWAETYPPIPHNPLMLAEQAALLGVCPDVSGRRVLDLACGSGRYGSHLQALGAAAVVGLDFSPAMLERASDCHRVRGDMSRLPFASGSFSAVISGLAIGHAANLALWFEECARVLDDSGCLLYSDFHPAAARAGMSRSFKDRQSRRWQVPHFVHEIEAHWAAAAVARLEIETLRELRAGEEFSQEFEGSDKFYREWRGLPLVLVVKAKRLRVAPSAETLR